ncbi:class I SAM-dependent methyltransferase [Streptomyces thermodiastaticus]|uniref:class I SAM-dependent methyltransferase n=1 Tax=Streptomyces thermodiastaticus TaxID=44061 RepID=UPI0016785D03|nr:class I SAM-dependent methyltransferase [Streptomyces thermodiastaticus]MCE7548991.1 class I SAM-dependent methyltransferase [Streptomyces thermodiastaticus]GHF75879.1 methyltransferase [Streptomyces thermodiastaticus]
MLDYDQEAEQYDALRGGEPRAAAAAAAVLGLLPGECRQLADIGCGTGIVTRRLAEARPALRVTGVDRSAAMVRRAAARLPGAVVRADGRRLPFPDERFDAVVSVWLLHLAPTDADARAVVAECARVLRPGGVYVTTVDKAASHNVGSDIDAVLAGRPPSPARDAADLVTAHAAAHGLLPAGQARFRGVGQGRSPRRTITDLRRGWFVTLPPGSAAAEAFAARLAALPDQERPRPDPVFALRAFRKPPQD